MKKTPLLAILLLFSISFIAAVPIVSTVFEGTVSYTGDSGANLAGYSINVSIWSSSVNWSVGTVGANNHFEIMVDPQGTGTLIHFYIGDVETVETGTYIMGGYVEQDLTITSLPTTGQSSYCGDGTCNVGETCSSCSADCGSCDDDDDDNNGGGGGGGSSDDDDDEIVIVQNNDGPSPGASVSNYYPDADSNTISKKKQRSAFMELLASGVLLTALIIAVIIPGLIILITPKGP